jgi:hypothetical protein
VDCLPLHVPGLTLVAEGVDGASRCGSELGEDANVDNVRGPAVSDGLWRAISAAVADAGWGAVTVDAFASESNARVPRFWSRFFEPGSEALDALCVLVPQPVLRMRLVPPGGSLRVPTSAVRAPRRGEGLRGPGTLCSCRSSRHPGSALEPAAGGVGPAATGAVPGRLLPSPRPGSLSRLVRLAGRSGGARRLRMRLRPTVPAPIAAAAVRLPRGLCPPPTSPLRQ